MASFDDYKKFKKQEPKKQEFTEQQIKASKKVLGSIKLDVSNDKVRDDLIATLQVLDGLVSAFKDNSSKYTENKELYQSYCLQLVYKMVMTFDYGFKDDNAYLLIDCLVNIADEIPKRLDDIKMDDNLIAATKVLILTTSIVETVEAMKKLYKIKGKYEEKIQALKADKHITDIVNEYLDKE